jgi:ATP-dependent helicase/nuclease subunit A
VDFFSWIPDNFKSETQGIQMETIYGAKGLQKKIVIIADGHKGPMGNSWNHSFLYNNFQGPCGNFKNLTIKNQWLTEKNHEIFQEYKRLMYVATTRSQEQLYIFGTYPVEVHSVLFFLMEIYGMGI